MLPLPADSDRAAKQGWVLIARDGKALGYAAETKLHKLN
jgi:hypothetical protein